MTARRALNQCDNSVTSDQNWTKQMLFHKVAVIKKNGGCAKASFTRLFCIATCGVEVGAVWVHCRVPSGLGLSFFGHGVQKLSILKNCGTKITSGLEKIRQSCLRACIKSGGCSRNCTRRCMCRVRQLERVMARSGSERATIAQQSLNHNKLKGMFDELDYEPKKAVQKVSFGKDSAERRHCQGGNIFQVF